MFKVYVLLALVSIVLMVVCLVDALSADDSRVRRLPRPGWVVLVLFLPLLGPLAWLALGRPVAGAAPSVAPAPRPGRPVVGGHDEDFAARVRERAQEQRRRYEEQRRRDQPEE